MQTLYLKAVKIVLIFLIIFSCNSSAKIKGKVVNFNNEGLSGVLVKIENTALSAATDQNGNYEIKLVPGVFKIIYEKDGFSRGNY